MTEMTYEQAVIKDMIEFIRDARLIRLNDADYNTQSILDKQDIAVVVNVLEKFLTENE